jgi:hypothetical protein
MGASSAFGFAAFAQNSIVIARSVRHEAIQLGANRWIASLPLAMTAIVSL